MARVEVFTVEPWRIAERELDLNLLAQTESIFALSNGHIGLRGNLDEGEPYASPGTFLNNFYEVRPLPYAEFAYGNPGPAQMMINVTDGKIIRLHVGDEPFDVRYGRVVRHERVLDLREGVLRREVEWVSPAGQGVRIRSARLVSFSQRAVAAITYEVEPLDSAVPIVVFSELVANEPVPMQPADPRLAAGLRAPLKSLDHRHSRFHATLAHRAQASGLRMVAAMDHEVDGPDGILTSSESTPDMARLAVSTKLEPGQRLRIVKFLAYAWSSLRSVPMLQDQVESALAVARLTGWDGLRREQRDWLDEVWRRGDVVLEGDPALQQAVRFAVFQVVQAAARADERGIPTKGLTGGGDDGHTFWDMEAYMLPMLTYVMPLAARDALRWRHATIDLAEARARELGLNGVAFPSRTIRGQECSGYWPASAAAFHINAAIANAVRRYLAATEDREFERGDGLELLVATARLWRSLGYHDTQGGFRIAGVTGPDEYTALVANNVYTNLMAARNLTVAAEVAVCHPKRAAELGVDEQEIASWRAAAAAVVIPFDAELNVTPQCEGFTRLRKWDFAATRPEDYPLLRRYHNYRIYSSQVVKQADLVFALYACGDRFDPAQKARDFAYYEGITVRDSSLSAAIQAIVAAEVGHLELAYDYLCETAFIDLHDTASNTWNGVHVAALAGAWLAAVAGFGGMRDYGTTLAFAPRLPARLTRLSFSLLYRGRRLRVDIRRGAANYELLDGEPLEILHYGEPLTLTADSPQFRPLPPLPQRPAPQAPPGRSPNLRQG